MKKDQVVILGKRGTLLITGDDAKDFFKILLLMILIRLLPKIHFFSIINSSRQVLKRVFYYKKFYWVFIRLR